MQQREQKYLPGIVCGLLLALPACSTCREVRIESKPPGAAVYLQSPGFPSSPMDLPEEEWERLGDTPLVVDSCLLTDELKASWEGNDLYLFDYSGSGYIRFDFEEGVVTYGAPRASP